MSETVKSILAGLLVLVIAGQGRASSTPEQTYTLQTTLATMMQAEAPDTNRALEEMLSQFTEQQGGKELAYDSWTLTAHRYLGLGIVTGSVVQAVLGSITWDSRKSGEEAGTADAHKYLGYTVAGMSLANATLGLINFWKMRDRDTGKKKRLAHLTLSTLATAGFVTAAYLAYDARQDSKNQSAGDFDDYYGDHRAIGLIAASSVVLTVAVIIW